MLYHKYKFSVQIKFGKAQFNTDKLRGLVEHLMVIPVSDDTIWDMKIIDKDGDVIFVKKNHQGRLDDKDGLPLSGDKQEKAIIVFNNVSRNEPIEIILKIREQM